jgi:hypothetical protein
MARYIKLESNEEKILGLVNSHIAITHHHSFNLGRQVERENGKGLQSGSYIKISGSKVHLPLFEKIIEENNIKLARHVNTNYRKEFNLRFIKSRFGESFVNHALGGGRILGSDSDDAKEFYESASNNSISKICESLREDGIDSAKKIKSQLKNEGLI